MFVILVPVNLAALLFVDEPFGRAVAVMAIGGIAPNLVLMVVQRGFSKGMAVSHLLFWLPLILLLLGMVTGNLILSSGFQIYIWVLLIVNVISYFFDAQDAYHYWQGNRAVAGK